ncbi:MAG: hypothetical protein HY682_03495 [Chloroflexi bacterium]|nr:hypothetical protein [Chloroflexota bacterium]
MRKTITAGAGLESTLGTASLVAVGDHIFTSGIVSDRPGSLESEARRAFQNAATLLHDAGSSLNDVVRTRVFFTESGGESALRSVHAGVFGNQGPALSVVRVSCLPHSAKAAVEIEAIGGASGNFVRHAPVAQWGACQALRAGDEIFVSGITAEWPGVGKLPSPHEHQVSGVCAAATEACRALGASLEDVVATRHFDPAVVHRHSFQGPALEDFRTPGEPTSAGITVEGVGADGVTFMLEAEAVTGAGKSRRNHRTGRTFEVEHHYSRSVRVGDIVYVAGSTSLVVGEVVQHPHEVYGQVLDTLETIRGTIEAQGLAWSDLVRTRSYIVGGIARLPDAMRGLKEVLDGMGTAATVTGVPVLGRPEVVVEIEATAVRDTGA